MGGAGTGSHEAHLAEDHVEKLWQFIEAARAKEPSSGNHAGISDDIELGHPAVGLHQLIEVILVALGVRIDLHASKLKHHKAPSLKADAFLLKEDRPWRRNLDPECDRDHDRQPCGESEKDEDKIESAFPARGLRTIDNGGFDLRALVTGVCDPVHSINSLCLVVHKGRGRE